jgi:hypothetical protein
VVGLPVVARTRAEDARSRLHGMLGEGHRTQHFEVLLPFGDGAVFQKQDVASNPPAQLQPSPSTVV